ncbi:MAG: (2Fe-2S)-binding protein [Candidatus Dependentiae bacterium]|nr:(2Fe-2S)-binding protein [Candidatus Dependentiae bacterium]
MGCCKKNNGKCQGSKETADYLVCTCMGVMRSEIIEAIDLGSQTFEELSQKLGVGTGCSSCVQEVKDLLRDKLDGGCSRS